jgi:carbonic anhydrase
MACNSPLNIESNKASRCESKCIFMFNYTGNSHCVVDNKTTSLSITYDGTGDIVFNGGTYLPTKMLLFKPSLHAFNGSRADAEVVIQHKATSSSALMLVCIPITSAAPVTMATGILSTIIETLVPDEPTTTVNINNFNAKFLIPTSSYYSYVGNDISTGQCDPNSTAQMVVFHKRDGAIFLEQTTLDALSQLIQDTNTEAVEAAEGQLSVNIKGTKSNGFAGEGQIYIDCQPTGVSEETIIYDDSAAPTKSSAQTNQMILILAGICIFLVLYFVFEYLATLFSAKPVVAEIIKQ